MAQPYLVFSLEQIFAENVPPTAARAAFVYEYSRESKKICELVTAARHKLKRKGIRNLVAALEATARVHDSLFTHPWNRKRVAKISAKDASLFELVAESGIFEPPKQDSRWKLELSFPWQFLIPFASFPNFGWPGRHELKACQLLQRVTDPDTKHTKGIEEISDEFARWVNAPTIETNKAPLLAWKHFRDLRTKGLRFAPIFLIDANLGNESEIVAEFAGWLKEAIQARRGKTKSTFRLHRDRQLGNSIANFDFAAAVARLLLTREAKTQMRASKETRFSKAFTNAFLSSKNQGFEFAGGSVPKDPHMVRIFVEQVLRWFERGGPSPKLFIKKKRRRKKAQNSLT